MVGAAGISAAAETRSGFTVVPFEPGHLLEVEPGEHERRSLSVIGLPKRIDAFPPGPAFTALRAGRAIGCAGLLIDGDEAVAWAFLSDEIRRCPMFLFRAARRNLDKISGNFRRIWMTVPSDFPVARRWARALGFHFNRNLPGYGLLGETHLEYVKWQPEL